MYGTAWKEEQTQRCVEDAIFVGFRAIDTANQRKHYYEEGVGKALKNIWDSGKLSRHDLFLQTKFTSRGGQDSRLPYDPNGSLTEQVQQSFASSLEHLHTSFLDSYVLHGPMTSRGLTEGDWEVWRAMEKLHEDGRAKYLGASNMNLEQIKLLYEGAAVKPKFLQNRCYARTGWDHAVRAFCKHHDIIYQGFSLLTANYEILNRPEFTRIALKYGGQAAQVIFRFASQVGMLPLTGTTNPEHMRDDLDCFKFELTQDEISSIEHILLKA
jgi:diketogulonate reductase-like aldo/keto reductase